MKMTLLNIWFQLPRMIQSFSLRTKGRYIVPRDMKFPSSTVRQKAYRSSICSRLKKMNGLMPSYPFPNTVKSTFCLLRQDTVYQNARNCRNLPIYAKADRLQSACVMRLNGYRL